MQEACTTSVGALSHEEAINNYVTLAIRDLPDKRLNTRGVDDAQFNEHGVCINCDEHEIFCKNHQHVTVSTAVLEGQYASALDVMWKLGGYGSPIIKQDFRHATLEEAMQSALADAKSYLDNQVERGEKIEKTMLQAVDARLSTRTQLVQLDLGI